MKLKNLMFATMIACAFTACSNDDDKIDNGGGGDGTTRLSIVTDGAAKTKADGVITEGDSLKFLVFGTDGKIATFKENTAGNLDADADCFISECREYTAGTYQVLVIYDPLELTKDFKTLKEYEDEIYTTLEDPNEVDLMLSSQIINITLTAGKHNLLGLSRAGDEYNVLEAKPIPLYRNVAKINLKEIIVSSGEYSDAKIEILDITVLSGRANTKIVAKNQWGSTEVADDAYRFGYRYELFAKYVAGTGTDNWFNSWATIADDDNYILEGTYIDKTQKELQSTVGTDVSYKPEFTFYAYENSSKTDHTVISIRTNFTYTKVINYDADGKETSREYETLEDRFYNIAIGADESGTVTWPTGNAYFNGKRDFYGVMRNLEYNIKATVKGPGADTNYDKNGGKKSWLDIQVEVVPYGQVSQEVEF